MAPATEAPPGAAFREFEINAAGRRIAVAEAGAGDALVCLHEGRGLHPSRTHALLATGRRVVLLDLAQADAALDELVRATLAAVAALGIARFDLLGQGRGASLALATALADPAAVRGLVLLGPTTIGGPDEALESRLGSIAVPSLALFGTRDPLAPPETARHYREKIPACNLVFIYDAGQAMDSERPEAVAAVVQDFLERHDHFLVSRDSGLIHP
jgi:pimeloyl-ACP methyl ester carboxylesterase